MKERIYIIVATVVFLTATGFAFQDQGESPKEKTETPASVKAEETLLRELEATKKELAAMKKESEADKRKRDSIDAERAVNLSITKKAEADLRMSNKALRTVTARLAYIVSKMNPDSAMKYYGEFDEIPARDSLKKKNSLPQVVVPEHKQPFFKRLFRKLNIFIKK